MDLLEGVWAGEQEALEPDMSRLEQDGCSSSSLPLRRLASRTEYLRSSTRQSAGLSRSMVWAARRWWRIPARLPETAWMPG